MNRINDDILIGACGDILLADFFFDIGHGMGSQIDKLGADYIFDEIRHLFHECGLLVGNLESPISTNSMRSGMRRREFLASPLVMSALSQAGFDVLGIANNHISQHGADAFRDTVRLLEMEGVLTPGVICTGREVQRLSVHYVKGKQIGVLAYSLADDHYGPSPKYYAFQPAEAKLLDQIAEQRNECDFLIVLMHWGEEFVNRPSGVQVNLAHKVIDAGCDLILGSHPHVIQGIESYKGKTIAYSLGNFVFSMKWKPTRASMLCKFQVRADGSQSFTIIPIWINNLFCPTIARGIHHEYVTNCIKIANELVSEKPLTDVAYNELVNEALDKYRHATRRAFIQDMVKKSPFVMLQLVLEFILRRIQ